MGCVTVAEFLVEVGLGGTFPAFYCLKNEKGETAAVMTIHADDLLYAYLPEYEEQIQSSSEGSRLELRKLEISGTAEISSCSQWITAS